MLAVRSFLAATFSQLLRDRFVPSCKSGDLNHLLRLPDALWLRGGGNDTETEREMTKAAGVFFVLLFLSPVLHAANCVTPYGSCVVPSSGPCICQFPGIIAHGYASPAAYVDPSPQYTYMGCYNDNRGANKTGTAGRDLPGFMVSSKQMTTAFCVNECAARNFEYAGTQWGEQCFCGDSPPRFGQAPGRCSRPCAGNSMESCGGDFANSVYRINQ